MAARVSADALLTEHFRYTPLSLIDDIINTVNAIVYRALQAIESGLLNTPPAALGYAPSKPDPKSQKNGANSAGKDGADADPDGAEAARAEIETGVHQLETLLEATVDRTFDKFELYTLRHLLSVDAELEPWIRLAHYEDLTLPTPPTAATPTSILALRQQLAASRDLNLALEDTNARASRLLSDVQSLLVPTTPDAAASAPNAGAFAFLAPHISPTKGGDLKVGKGSPSPSSAPLATAAGFATSQLPALRALLAELRPRARALAAAAAEDPGLAGGGEADERREYIESTSRRVVMDAVGAAEGEEEGTGLGREVTMEDVRALEKVVGSGALGAGDRTKAGEEGPAAL